ncbi:MULTISPECIES: pyrimidine 5'-nucleotidase [unclassified Neisseria]|uniref:pyrimidine 5'-nucleotidase n=1 Tax=unclassified Neisseria TaxID=2623750 RepID=UPI0010723697|nr:MULTISPECIES: pyrimidine 5'-nucleotidase [unclassified Neisseria]MBF0804022.1 pyrimidine 5'-nucleotidase [Neisseria sp. 19428wB4_WF04]TFU43227.1 pyrimidine 5'-nucleotidase [Neisseria sp. WF04]
MNCQTVWLFDLDNTLHHADAGIFALINRRMTAYLASRLNLSQQTAGRLRQDYWHRYGTTLAGLRLHHPEVCVNEFLQYSHPLPEILPALVPVEGTAETLGRLKGRKAVFSNAPSFYVAALIEAMGIAQHFDALFGIDDFGLFCKPHPQSYLTVCGKLHALPRHCIMVDDSAGNLQAAKNLGMKTVWFGARSRLPPFADCAAPDMAALRRWSAAAEYATMNETTI